MQNKMTCLKLSIGINSKFCFGTNKLLLKDYLNENLSISCFSNSMPSNVTSWSVSDLDIQAEGATAGQYEYE